MPPPLEKRISSLTEFTQFIEQSLELSHRLKIYAYDAYLIACALTQGCALLTLDGGLSYAAKAAGLTVMEVT